MKTLQQFLLLFLVSLGLVSCGDSHASLTDEALENMDEAIEILEKLEDGGELDEAIKSLDALAEKSADLEKRAKELGDPDEGTQKEVDEKLEKYAESNAEKMKEIMGKLMTSGKATPELVEALSKVMKGK